MMAKTGNADMMATASGGCLGAIENVIYEIPFVENKSNKTATTHLSTVWYEQYTREPRLCMPEASWQKVSNPVKTVFTNELFLDVKFNLDETLENCECESAQKHNFCAQKDCMHGLGYVLEHARHSPRWSS